MPKDIELKEKILTEAQCLPYSIHVGADKLFMDLK